MAPIFAPAKTSSLAIAIQDVTVVDVAAGALRPHMTAIVDGDKIVMLGPIGAVAPPAGARVVKGTGKFLAPGFWDMRVHLGDNRSQLPAYLAFGVTGVRDRGGDFDRIATQRLEIEHGAAMGPHIVTSGTPVGKLNSGTPQLARQTFDRLFKSEVDFIQVLSDLSRDSYLALAEQARHWHLRLDGDIPSDVSAWEALDARQGIIENLTELGSVPEETAVKFFDRAAMMGTRISPLLVPGVDLARLAKLTALAKKEKVEILAGTGSGEAYTQASNLGDELSALVAAGLAPREALEAATLAPARLLGWEDLMGSVERGKMADLVLLNGNPLEDIANVRKIDSVFAKGRYYSRQDLDLILAAR